MEAELDPGDSCCSRIPGFKPLFKLGTGSYSKVYCAIHVDSGARVAIKAINKLELQEDDLTMEAILKEVDIHRKLLHPNIATFYGSLEDQTHYYCVIELASGQSLLNLVNMCGGLCEDAARRNFVQLICAVKYLHENKGVIHRDIKLDNILFDSMGNLKLLDFGFGNTGKDVYTTQCGSYPYVAPELFSGESYTTAIDIWSCGVVLYAMLTGRLPFYSDNMGVLVEMIQRACPDYSGFPSDSSLELVHKMLTKDPARRIKLTDICNHPWVKAADNAGILTVNYDKLYEDSVLKREIDFAMKKVGGEAACRGGEMLYRIVRQQVITGNVVPMERAKPRTREPKISSSMVFPELEELEGAGRRGSEPDSRRTKGYRRSLGKLLAPGVTPVRCNYRKDIRRSMNIPPPTFL